MTITVANTANTNTFEFWKNRTNDLAHAMSNYVVTVDSNTTVGNATIQGTITANVFQISNSSGTWILSPVTSNNNILISGISVNSLVDSFTIADYRGAEYTVTVDDNTANNRYLTKLLITHNNTDPLMTEYGSITTNSDIGTFSSYSNATHITLNFNSLVSNATVRYARIIV